MQIKTSLIKIGNSRGIRIPAKVIEATELTNHIGLQVLDNGILISPYKKTPRQGWSEAFKKMHQNKDDRLLIPDDLDNKILEDLEW